MSLNREQRRTKTNCHICTKKGEYGKGVVVSVPTLDGARTDKFVCGNCVSNIDKAIGILKKEGYTIELENSEVSLDLTKNGTEVKPN